MAKNIFINHNSNDAKQLNDLVVLRESINKYYENVSTVSKGACENYLENPDVYYYEWDDEPLVHIPYTEDPIQHSVGKKVKKKESLVEYFKSQFEKIKEKYYLGECDEEILRMQLECSDNMMLAEQVERRLTVQLKKCLAEARESKTLACEILLFKIDRIIRGLSKNKYINNNFIRAHFIHALIRSHFRTSPGENDGEQAQSLNNESTINPYLKIIHQDEIKETNFKDCEAAA